MARFQADDGPPVMLVSLKAGGTGLNLTAADHVFLCDPWWNPAVEEQAADRAHRIGQTRPVIVYRLVAGDTVEERILTLQDSKRALMDAALADGAAAAASRRPTSWRCWPENARFDVRDQGVREAPPSTAVPFAVADVSVVASRLAQPGVPGSQGGAP